MRAFRITNVCIIFASCVLSMASCVVTSHHVRNRPQVNVVRTTCPPYDQCTPSGAWNHPRCSYCWGI